MQLPSFLEVYEGLISTPSISATDPKWDQGNEQVIAKLAGWLSDLGFQVTIDQVAPGKQNLIAKKGEGKAACYCQATAIPCRLMKGAGTIILMRSRRITIGFTASAPPT